MADLIPVEISILWRWDCSSENKILFRSQPVRRGGPGDTRLADYRALKDRPGEATLLLRRPYASRGACR